MSFSFIQLFFFISLGIVLSLILLLCYYLKNKIDVLEKQAISFRDILSNLIKEIKNHFLEHEQYEEKTEQKKNVDPIVEKNDNNITIHIDDVETVEKEEATQSHDTMQNLHEWNIESPCWNTVVNLIIDSESESLPKYDHDVEIIEESVLEIIPDPEPEFELEIIQEPEPESEPNFELEIIQEPEQETIQEAEQISKQEIKPENIHLDSERNTDNIQDTITITEASEITRDEIAFDEIIVDKPIRKMSLIQLKQYALAHNLVTYPNKMKKEELIRLIEEKEKQ